MRDEWTNWRWREDPNAPKTWHRPERSVVVVEGISGGALLQEDVAADAFSAVEQSPARQAAYVCIETPEVLAHPTVRAPWRPRDARDIPALRAERYADLTTDAVKTLGSVVAAHHALVLSPREMIDLFRLESTGRDTDHNWIAYTDVLHGYRYAGSYDPVDNHAFTDVPAVDLVIVQGPTGPDAWPMHPAWVRLTRDQCERAGIAFVFTGWGDWCPSSQAPEEAMTEALSKMLRSRALRAAPAAGGGIILTGGHAAPVIEETRVSHYHDDVLFYRLGAERSGRFLDEVEHLKLPAGL